MVMQLREQLLNSGRTLVTDNYYTSIDLANQLLGINLFSRNAQKQQEGHSQSVLEKRLKKT